MVQHLRQLDWSLPDQAEDWAQRFDETAAERMAQNPGGVLELVDHPDYARAVPTPDHFIPLLYLAGLAAAEGKSADALVRGYAYGSLSMTCYGVGAEVRLMQEGEHAAGLPADVPPDQTNM